jgi:hypothetical protein
VSSIKTPGSADPQWGPVVTATVSFKALGGGGISTGALSEVSVSDLFGEITEDESVWHLVPTTQQTQGH